MREAVAGRLGRGELGSRLVCRRGIRRGEPGPLELLCMARAHGCCGGSGDEGASSSGAASATGPGLETDSRRRHAGRRAAGVIAAQVVSASPCAAGQLWLGRAIGRETSCRQRGRCSGGRRDARQRLGSGSRWPRWRRRGLLTPRDVARARPCTCATMHYTQSRGLAVRASRAASGWPSLAGTDGQAVSALPCPALPCPAWFQLRSPAPVPRSSQPLRPTASKGLTTTPGFRPLGPF